MNKLKLFLENFLVYGLGGVINKIIPLIMVPIVTRMMPSSEYFGVNDLSHTLISFCSAFAIMGMYDAMYRMFFEKEEKENQKKVCSTALCFTLVTSVVVFLIMLLFKSFISSYFFGGKEYINVVYLSAIATLVGSTNSIIAAPTRMQNNRKIYLLANIASPMLSYAMSIPLLLKGYYLIALPLSGVISGITLELFFLCLNRGWFKIRLFDAKLLKQMLLIGVPLLPNFLVYWLFNSCDKVMITNMIGIGAAGIYSVGSKLGHASQLIYTAFAGGWQYFSFSTMKEKNQVESNSKIFEYLGIISFIATAFICSISYIFYDVLFTKEYLEGFIVAPYLFLAPLLQMLFQVAANQFIIIKKTWPNMLILSAGAGINLILNFILIPSLGIEGAAIATLIGYFVSDIICVVVLIRMKLMSISSKFVFSAILIAVFIVVWRCFMSSNFVITVLLAVFLSILYGILYRGEIFTVISKFRKDEYKN
ncbi:MAG: polysaccharide biosynthesis protein [Ruminococcaceae bacterium]|nr:polysaccharide biosynthesis protein [Oscillospiraceae bacterium]